jgi:hypothetical protein
MEVMMTKKYGSSLLLFLICAGTVAYVTLAYANADTVTTAPAVAGIPAPDLPAVAQFRSGDGPVRPDLIRLTPIARDGTPVGPERAVELTPVLASVEQ